jgi:hypothetical protein
MNIKSETAARAVHARRTNPCGPEKWCKRGQNANGVRLDFMHLEFIPLSISVILPTAFLAFIYSRIQA